MDKSRLSGLIIVKKEEGMTSQAVVNRVKRIMNVDKAGHTGTLDPLATGVLPVLIGRAVKASEFMLTADKHYGATLLLGETFDTEDVTGNRLTYSDTVPDEKTVMAKISEFVGEVMQTPPMYSALKVGGKKLCDLAREGVTVDREARKITVYSIKATKLSEREYFLDVVCSKGTYIRTLCADIGASLGVGGAMKTLVRLSASGFTIDEAHTLGELEGMSESEKESVVINTERIFDKLDVVVLPDFFARLALSGLEIYQKKIHTAYDVGTRVRLYSKNGFFAVGEVREYDDGTAIKPIRQF